MIAADQVVDLGRLPGGAVVTVHNRGGLSRATNFRREINGAEGDLVASASVGHPQLSSLTLEGGRGTSTAQASSGTAVSPTPSRRRRRRRLCERCAGKLRFSHIRRRNPLRGTPGQTSDIDVRNLNSAPLTGFLPLEYSIRGATVELPIRGSRQSGLRWRSDGRDPARCAGSVRRAFREPLDRPFGSAGPAWMFSMGVMGGVVMGVSTRLAAGSPCRRVRSGVAVRDGLILDSKRLAVPCRHRVAGVWAGGAHRVAGRLRRGGGEPLRREGGRRRARASGSGAAARDRRTLRASPRPSRIWLAPHRS